MDGVSAFWFSTNVSFLKPLLVSRKTQINAYELFSVLVALHALGDRLRSRHVACLIDNSVALWSLRNGSSSALDLSVIAHAIWSQARHLEVQLHGFWVPSKLNLADAPSRGARPRFGDRVSLELDLRALAHSVLR